MDNKIGNFIKELRTEKNWSQEELASKLYISRQSVSKWELGLTTPSMSVMIKLAEIFDLTLPEMLNGERATKDNIKEINSSTTKEIIKMHKRTKKISLISTIVIVILALSFLGYYFFTSYKSQNIYYISSDTEEYNIEGLFITTKSKIYFTIQNIESKEDIEELTLYYMDNGERKDIYTKENITNIFLNDTTGYNEYFDIENKKMYINNLYLEIKTKKETQDFKLDFKRIYQNDELIKLNRNNAAENNDEPKELDSDKLIEKIKSTFKKNKENYALNIDDEEIKLELNYIPSTNSLSVNKYTNNIKFIWKYNLNNKYIIYEKVDTLTYETVDQDSGNLEEDKEFINEFYKIIKEYVYR